MPINKKLSINAFNKYKYTTMYLISYFSEELLESDYTHFIIFTALLEDPSLIQEINSNVALKERVIALKKACENIKTENFNAQFLLLFFLQFGIGDKLDASKAVDGLESLIQSQNILINQSLKVRILNHLGLTFRNGLCGISIDIPKAIKYHHQAYDMGYASGAHNLGSIYHTERSVMDAQKAAHWYEIAIAMNHPAAMVERFRLFEGNFFVRGFHGSLTSNDAIALIEQAITLKYPAAYFFKARFHERTSEYFEVAKCFEMANRGGVNVETELSVFYMKKITDWKRIIELFWHDLVKGKSLSNALLKELNRRCKQAILEKFLMSSEGSSIEYIKKIAKNLQHPMAQILNDFNQNKACTEEFIFLLKQVPLLVKIRAMFFYNKKPSSLPNDGENAKNMNENCLDMLPHDLKKEVFNHVQSGFFADSKINRNLCLPEAINRRYWNNL